MNYCEVFLTTSNNFLSLSCISCSILVYLVFLEYLGLSRCISVYLGVSRCILHLYRSISGYFELFRIISGYLRLSQDGSGYLGLYRAILTISNYPWVSLAISDYLWLPLVTSVSLTILGYLDFFLYFTDTSALLKIRHNFYLIRVMCSLLYYSSL